MNIVKWFIFFNNIISSNEKHKIETYKNLTLRLKSNLFY